MEEPTCFGCGVTVPDELGTYYCPTCVAEQMAEEREERIAFDAFHRWADAIAKGDR